MKASSVRTEREYELLDERGQCVAKIMWHPDLGWGWYQRYGTSDWERDEDLTRQEVADELSYVAYRTI